MATLEQKIIDGTGYYFDGEAQEIEKMKIYCNNIT